MDADVPTGPTAQRVRSANHLLHGLGLPLDAITAGAHAEIAAMMAAYIGGREAAASCERAAERVRNLPSAPVPTADEKLAAAQPMGRA